MRLATAMVLAAAPMMAQAQVRVLASNGVRAVLEQVRPQAERAVGAKLDIDYGTSTGLKQRIESGEKFDVAILTTELIDELAKSGQVSAAESATLGRSGIGVGVRKGAAKPDIRTAGAFKKAMQSAKVITYAQDGASRAHIEKMFEEMGIADAMKKKTILEQGSTRANQRVANGDADIVLTLESEILPAPGVELAGPIPAEYQSYVAFAAAAGAKAGNAAGARALIKFLSGPAVTGAMKSKGMER